jgi:hypothetical protein
MRIQSLIGTIVLLASSISWTIMPNSVSAQTVDVPARVIRSCQERAAREFSTSPENVQISDTTTNRQGTYTVFLQPDRVNITIACEVTRDGTIRRFSVAPPTSQPANPNNVPAVVIQSCREQALTEFGLASLANVEVYNSAVNRQGTYTVMLRSRRSGATATCEANRDGSIRRFLLQATDDLEDVVSFRTQNYSVRVYRQRNQLYMNVFNRRSNRLELSAAPTRQVSVGQETEYIADGAFTYYARAAGDRRYSLEVVKGDRVIVQEPGF